GAERPSRIWTGARSRENLHSCPDFFAGDKGGCGGNPAARAAADPAASSRAASIEGQDLLARSVCHGFVCRHDRNSEPNVAGQIALAFEPDPAVIIEDTA